MKSTVVPEGLEGPPHVPLWRNRDYMLLWSGQAVSLTGTVISQTAFPLLVWDLTHSAALVGRWDRKRVMILCDMGRALNLVSVLAALMLGHLTVIQLCINALVEGTFFVFFNLSEVACLPRVVAKEQLPAATAQNESTMGMTTLLGPLLGGALYGVRQALPFVADAVSYAVSVCSLLFIKTKFQQERTQERRKLYIEIKEGLVWLWRQPLIRYMAFLTGGLNLVNAGFIPILVVLVKQQHGSSLIYGVILTIGGVGGIAGALLGPPIQKRFRFGTVIISTVWVGALLWPLYAIAPNPIILGVITALSFINGPVYNVVQFSYRLALIPDELQGRVNSVFRLLAFGFQPLGWVVTGVLIQVISVIPTILVLFVVCLVLAILTMFNPHVRHARPLSEVQVG